MRLPVVLLLLVILPACAARDGGFPSLALRDAERKGGVQPPSTDRLALVDTAPPSAEVRAQIAAQVAQARAAHARFLAALPAARRTVSAGGSGSVDTDAYAAAQIALGDLQAISSETAFALGDLDTLLAARSNGLQSTAEVAAAQAEVAALLRDEITAIETLERALR